MIQGNFLAKKGLWVSEYRIESGLNCGGHAFATDGFLLGPILEEFHQKKEQLNYCYYGVKKIITITAKTEEELIDVIKNNSKKIASFVKNWL